MLPSKAKLSQLQIENCCHVCGSRFWKYLYPVRDVNQDIPCSWEMIACRRCGLGCLLPLPTPKEAASFYDNRFYTSDNMRFSPLVEFIRKLLAFNRVNLVGKYLPQSGYLLDLGSGPGHFGTAMEKHGWTVRNEDIAYGGEGRLVMENQRPVLDYPDCCFDAVSLWYVIEHMVSPRATFREIFRVLKPGGMLITSQQDFSSYQARFFGPSWLILDPPRHIFQFSPSNLSELANQEGFTKIGIDHSSIEFGPFTILQSILNKLLGNENYLFKILKNRKLNHVASDHEKVKRERRWGFISAILGIWILPFAIAVYFLLLIFRSGDIFTLILRKEAP